MYKHRKIISEIGLSKMFTAFFVLSLRNVIIIIMVRHKTNCVYLNTNTMTVVYVISQKINFTRTNYRKKNVYIYYKYKYTFTISELGIIFTSLYEII